MPEQLSLTKESQSLEFWHFFFKFLFSVGLSDCPSSLCRFLPPLSVRLIFPNQEVVMFQCVSDWFLQISCCTYLSEEDLSIGTPAVQVVELRLVKTKESASSSASHICAIYAICAQLTFSLQSDYSNTNTKLIEFRESSPKWPGGLYLSLGRDMLLVSSRNRYWRTQ